MLWLSPFLKDSNGTQVVVFPGKARHMKMIGV
jgi:hypothetical protein